MWLNYETFPYQFKTRSVMFIIYGLQHSSVKVCWGGGKLNYRQNCKVSKILGVAPGPPLLLDSVFCSVIHCGRALLLITVVRQDWIPAMADVRAAALSSKCIHSVLSNAMWHGKHGTWGQCSLPSGAAGGRAWVWMVPKDHEAGLASIWHHPLHWAPDKRHGERGSPASPSGMVMYFILKLIFLVFFFLLNFISLSTLLLLRLNSKVSIHSYC